MKKLGWMLTSAVTAAFAGTPGLGPPIGKTTEQPTSLEMLLHQIVRSFQSLDVCSLNKFKPGGGAAAVAAEGGSMA